MQDLQELERTLALHHEGERLRQEYAHALSERAAAEKESRQVEDMIRTLAGPAPLSRELLPPLAPPSPEPRRFEIIIRPEQSKQSD